MPPQICESLDSSTTDPIIDSSDSADMLYSLIPDLNSRFLELLNIDVIRPVLHDREAFPVAPYIFMDTIASQCPVTSAFIIDLCRNRRRESSGIIHRDHVYTDEKSHLSYPASARLRSVLVHDAWEARGQIGSKSKKIDFQSNVDSGPQQGLLGLS